MNADKIVVELREQGFNAERRSVGAVNSTSYEYDVINSDSLCSIHVTRGEQLAEIVWFDNGYVESVFVISDDPIFRASVADFFFSD